MRRRQIVGFAVVGVVLGLLDVAAAGPVTKVTITAPAGQAGKDVPVTFGQVFKKGDVKQGVAVSAGGAVGQADVKRKYDDGSVRFAVISLIAGELPVTVEVSDGLADRLAKPVPVSAVALLKTDFDAVVTLQFRDGKSVSASARKMLEAAGDQAKTRLAGPVATEWLLYGPLLDKDGKADPDLAVQFQVRSYTGCKAVRVSVVVENCLDHWAGNIGYDAAVTIGKDGKAVYEKKDVDHRRLSRWRKTFWWGEGAALPAAVTVAHDFAYMSATGALPNYDRSIKIPNDALAALASRWAKSTETGIMGSGSLTKYMPTTGGREEIGPYPSWTVKYLLSMDPRAKAVVLGNGDLAGSWPIHIRDSKTGRIMTLDDRPKFWFGSNSPDKPVWQPDRKPPPAKGTPEDKAYTLTPDVAHMGSFAFVPYLVTGDFYYLEEAYFWGNFALLAQWQVPREDAKGLMRDQIRGDAWGLRNIADAGFIAADGDPEAKYFEQRIRNNIEYRIAKMHGPPEYNKMGFWGIRTVPDARIQDAANPNWIITAPWEHDYLMWSMHHLTEVGYADAAKVRDFELRWRVGAFTQPDEFDPMLGAPYRMVVGEMGPDKQVTFYEDWKKLGQENAKLSKPNLSYNYSAYLALMCGVDAGFPKAAEAAKVLLDKGGGFSGMLAAPEWRLVARNPQPAPPAK